MSEEQEQERCWAGCRFRQRGKREGDDIQVHFSSRDSAKWGSPTTFSLALRFVPTIYVQVNSGSEQNN